MNVQLLNKAKERVPSIPILINMVSKRVRQLTTGFRPYVKPDNPNEDMVDTALREIAEGVLIAEMDFAAPDGAEDMS